MTTYLDPWCDGFDLARSLDTTYQGALRVLRNLADIGLVDATDLLRPQRFHLNDKGREYAEKWGRS